MIKICPICEKEFKTTHKERKHCSYPCAHKSQTTKFKKVCEQCKKCFIIHPCRLKNNRGRFCSKKCFDITQTTSYFVNCKNCKKRFLTKPSLHAKFCSYKCAGISHANFPGGKWKGEKASYRTKHNWVVRKKGKAIYCEHCGLDKIPKGKQRYFQWANISGKYFRDITDYKSLCIPCHKHFDGYGN